ncbi:MAG TPA: hypothetical protein VED22_01685, partial [Nitrososphaerales archaeon]|nr:hypothetical protein [Nitrososphaerales archaeon]
MERWKVVASVTVSVLVVGAVFFVIATRPSSNYTSRVGCTDYETFTYEEPSTFNESVSYGSVTTTTAFTTTTNTSATVGYTTAYGFTLPPLTNAVGNAVRSCTFIR